MKFKTKAIPTLIVSLALAAAGSAMAQSQFPAPYSEGDLLLGFTVGSGPDLVVNLGPVGTALVNGNSWNVANLLATNFNAGSLSEINFGIIGETSVPNTVYSTKVGSVNTFANQSAFNVIFAAIQGVGNNLNGSTGFGTPDANAVGSWNQETLVGGASTFKNAYQNPNITGTTPPSTVNFYTVTQGTSRTNIVQTGTFTLAPTGVLSFSTSTTVTPPPPQIVSITRAANVSTVIFTTTNGSFTYSLLYTNSAGISAPRSTWPVSATTVTGNGNTNSISDTTTDPNRVYSVRVH
ncbi:MAG TPA: hypothetical protein VKV04_15955 [Verrucomicrobiae bacterium]|nr:hypothetical protein [Verrucomicrobiae bacterium]